MTIAELKEFINRIPDEMNDYTVENAEFMDNDNDDIRYRLDKPVIAIYIREDTKELLLMNEKLSDHQSNVTYKEITCHQ
jgi:hypothetical protein